MSPPSRKLLNQLRDQILVKHYSSRSEEAYAYWVREFILFHKAKSGTFRHPGELGDFGEFDKSIGISANFSRCSK